MVEGDLRSALAALISSEAGSIDSLQELGDSTLHPGSNAEWQRLDVDLVSAAVRIPTGSTHWQMECLEGGPGTGPLLSSIARRCA